MRNHLFLFFIVLSFYSCSNSKVWRNPANINEKKDLQTIIEELNDAVKEEITTSEQCSEGLSHYYKTLFKMTSEDVNWDQLEDNYLISAEITYNDKTTETYRGTLIDNE